MALPLGHDTRKFCDTPAYATLRADQYVMRQDDRDARALQHKLTRDIAEAKASDLTTEAMQAARIRAARAQQED